jgi:hypothetical protein
MTSDEMFAIAQLREGEKEAARQAEVVRTQERAERKASKIA